MATLAAVRVWLLPLQPGDAPVARGHEAVRSPGWRTSEAAMPTFSPHGGLIDISREGRMLRVVGGGATNAEGIQRYLAALRPWLETMRGAPWATLGIVEPDGALLTPDAEAVYARGVHVLAAAGRVAMALVCPPFPGSTILRNQWERIFAGCASELALFEDETAARTWIIDRLRAHGVDEAALPSAAPMASGQR